jgi:hypothetical protein
MKIVRIVTHAPKLTPSIAAVPAQKIEASGIRPPSYGPAMWEKLHRRAGQYQGDDSAWMKTFSSEVPCGKCRKDWREMLARTPPDWDKYFAWTVDRHNEINAKLGKPIMSLEEARARWLQN